MIVEEAPTARGPEHDTLPITREGGFYTCASGGLGYSLPAAVGVAAGQNDKVIAILGDGSAMYTIQGLFSAREEAANVSFVILNNSGYAALTGFAGEFGMNHVPGCDLSGIDFVKLAEAQGLPARLVDAVEAIDEALQLELRSARAVAARRPDRLSASLASAARCAAASAQALGARGVDHVADLRCLRGRRIRTSGSRRRATR